MIHFDLPQEQSSIIKVIGIGGGGSNAVNYMHSLGIGGVDFIVCNTDAQALQASRVPNKIQLGPSLTQGLGAGANPEIGRQATEESLDEIRRILQVNTKMAFVTAGMGGGTGTGGTPIIARICRDMGILTVGIVTMPFSYEGKKRTQYAEAGIKELKQCVDTLLVISNDKLRHQFGNLTMSAALSTADNVLATAAKCITDVINNTGQINVDFADVCTVMRNGGVAILGSARAKGENRASVAIEQALNSPLLNDNDIKGAKWILININSKAGDTEYTMDEVETIQHFLLTRAGEDADIIFGLGYDESLGEDIGITIIATGFHQNPVSGERVSVSSQAVDNGRVTYTLETAVSAPVAEAPLAVAEPVANAEIVLPEDETPVVFELDLHSNAIVAAKPVVEEKEAAQTSREVEVPSTSRPSGSFLVKPSIIYEEPATVKSAEQIQVSPEPPAGDKPQDAIISEKGIATSEQVDTTFELVFHEAPKAAPVQKIEPVAYHETFQPRGPVDEAEAQKAKAAERLYKLRNLSFNFNAADPNNEYESVPAYVRQNLQVQHNSMASVEKFYSSYAVSTDDDNMLQISTINTFLEGKKPD